MAESIIETFTDTNFVLTPDGDILDFKSNASFLRYIFPGSLHNKRINDVFPAKLAEQLEQALRTVQQSGNIVPLEYVLPTSNREYWFDARLIPVTDSKVMLIARDITECRETKHPSS